MNEVKCTTCKGTKTIEFERGQRCVPCVTCSGSGIDWRKTCESAQSELAALREELAGYKQGAKVEADAADEARAALKATEQLPARYSQVAVIEYTGYEPSNSLKWLNKGLHYMQPGTELYVLAGA